MTIGRLTITPYAYLQKIIVKTVARIVDATDVESYALSIIWRSRESELVVLGTDDGINVSFNAGEKMAKNGRRFPYR